MYRNFKFLGLVVGLLLFGKSHSQTVSLAFTGRDSVNKYVQLDSIAIYNLTKGWQETIYWPDTVITLSTPAGIADAQEQEIGLSSYPNPFNGTSLVKFTLSQSEQVQMAVYNIAGQRIMEYHSFLEAGTNYFDISFQKPQVYFLVVNTVEGRFVQKLVNLGYSGDNYIEYRSTTSAQIEQKSKSHKSLSSKPYNYGDMMEYVGYATINGHFEESQHIAQPQNSSQTFILNFDVVSLSPFISSSDNTRIIFAPGNLQWSATGTHAVAGGGTSMGTWRFASNQWEFIGPNNKNISSTYSDWIDLFGWGTSGYNNKYPYITSTSYSDYANNNIFGTNYDWGVYNAIYNPQTNAFDSAGTWRTITKEEWEYLLNTRITTSGIRYAKAKVNDVNGLIIVPDNWSNSTYKLKKTNTASAAYSSNVISAIDWKILENAGAIFFPITGYRFGTLVSEFDLHSFYWSSSYNDNNRAYDLYFNSDYVAMSYSYCYYGRAVRLVRNFSPVISTTTASNITATSAVSGGVITSEGIAPVTDRGICWSTSQNPTINDNYTTDGSGIGSFTSSLTNLTPNTTYYVRAYATNFEGTIYGNEITFTTSATLPTITTITASNITATTATSGGDITYDGGDQVIDRGICWSTSQNPTINDNYTTDGSGIGSFTSSLTNLTPNTTYYVRAYATNSVGTIYGNEITLTTSKTLPTLTTIIANNVTATTAASGGDITSDGGDTVTVRGLCWSTSHNPTINDNYTIDGDGIGSFIRNITDLRGNTTYYVRAYATNSVGTAYGNEISFTTSKSAPILTTTTISNITATTATSGGDITYDGGAQVTVRGICWSTSPNPTINDNHTTDGSGIGSFTSNMIGLIGNTTYYVRAYATNSIGTAYGNEITFTTAAVVPTLTTINVSAITVTTAISGGDITDDGGDTVTDRGICWSTSPNPTINDNHTTDGNGIGSFVSNITDLSEYTTYYVRAYATNSVGTAYGNEITFTTKKIYFSVAAENCVYFSSGNLQWSATGGGDLPTTHAMINIDGDTVGEGTWRFAPNQWDIIGADNKYIDSTYKGWIDLFGFATNGWRYDHGDVRQPYAINYHFDCADLVVCGIAYGSNSIDYDWGANNAIYNPKTGTTDPIGMWRTLTEAEWDYLLNKRSTTSGIRYALAKIHGVPGLVIVPDKWSTSIYVLNNPNTTMNYQDIDSTKWAKMEKEGVVFLPAAGYRYGTSVEETLEVGYYWTATCNCSNNNSSFLLFFTSVLNTPMIQDVEPEQGMSVRLVRPALREETIE